MDFNEIKAPTLKELFVKEIETMILSGKLKIGEKIPSERDLAKKMQVSRTVINSGILELSRKGFLEVKPRSGVYVMDYRRYGTIDTLLSIMNYNGGQLQKEDIRSILELKMVVDRLSFELVVDRYENEDLKLLEEILEKLKVETDDNEEAAKIAFNFYHEMAIISQNTLLPLIYSSFRIPVTHLWTRFIKKYGQSVVYINAKNIYEAIIIKDKELAVSLAEKTMVSSISGSLEIYDD